MRLNTFPGGIHSPTFKEFTATKPIKEFPFPSRVVLPLLQHTGAPLSPLVKKGDRVKRGQKIADVEAFICAPLHSPLAGKVAGIEDYFHPLQGRFPALTIENDGSGEEERKDPLCDIENKDPAFLREWIREGGMVGLGGAAFPTHVKVSPPPGKKIDTFILNGAECEPYLTCDYRVMIERSSAILTGLRVLVRACGAERVFIGIEENKIEAIEKFDKLVKDLPFPARVVPLLTKYPQGSEKQLIVAILGREVPPGGLPLDVGVVVNNVQTAWAVGRMAEEGLPLIERVITLSGECLKSPENLQVPLGTVLSDLVDFCGGWVETPKKVIMGGPMMGVAQTSLQVPVVKGTSGFVFLSNLYEKKEYPCIRCRRCIDACPMRLFPTMLGKFSEYQAFDEARDQRVLDCMECGACSYVCPSNISLTHLIRLAKAEVMRRSRKGGNQ